MCKAAGPAKKLLHVQTQYIPTPMPICKGIYGPPANQPYYSHPAWREMTGKGK